MGECFAKEIKYEIEVTKMGQSNSLFHTVYCMQHSLVSHCQNLAGASVLFIERVYGDFYITAYEELSSA